ncbi:MAG: hypothetical protein LGR52_16215 [Candidatus Thiosymbion ectosymbiont of Robbea hypermnestra]|nr:hypothetical protein [Candidatus Thiosymbion ectosymbiont of Robbea hypermnestra]
MKAKANNKVKGAGKEGTIMQDKGTLKNTMASANPQNISLALHKRFLQRFIETHILGRFYKIELTNFEKGMADDAVVQKYIPAISQTVFYSLLLVPALLILNTEIVVSVLIPTTMVAGTAWFSVSLASMKKKFEKFGMELTKHLFVAFSLSLMMLLLATLASLTAPLWQPLIPPALTRSILTQMVSAALAIFVVGKLLFSIFSGSLKYDINDAMLTGQNEVAERFFKQSLSLMFITAQQLRTGMPLQVANYYLGLCFYEIFNNILELKITALKSVEKLIEEANKLIRNPSMTQEEADKIVLALIQLFIDLCSKGNDVQEHHSYQAIEIELDCLNQNTREDRKMIDIRMSVVLSEISNLIEEFGPMLFDDHVSEK